MFFVLSLCLFAVPSLASYSASDDVITLDSSNFQSKVINSDDLWIVEFYAPWCGHCQSLEPEYKNAAKALKGIVKLGAVDADSDKSLGGQYGIKGFPTIKVFGSNKNKPTDYQGARSASGIVDSAMSLLKSLVQERLSGKKGGGGSRSSGKPEDVIELTDANFDELVMKSDDLWLVEFFAPWCGHCKNLAPHWQSAASDLKGKVKLGALDATVHTIVAGRYQVQGYPTIKYFPSGKKDEPLEYDGGRTGNDIVQWATDKLAENVPPPEVVELTEHSQLESSCNDHQLCVISFLPNILDCQSECRNKFLQILKNMGEKYKKKMWGWLWMEGGAQLDMEDAFGVGGFGYPAMAAMNARKMKFSLMKGSFSETGINEFLRELAVGRGSTAPVKNAKLPSVFKREPWDGKDGVLPVEEDIDLSDIDLDDLDTKKDEL